MFERASSVLAVGEEFAVLFALVRKPCCWRGVASDAFAVFAGSTKAANVVDIDRNTRRRSWRLMCEFAVFVCAVKIVFADRLIRVWRLALAHINILAFGSSLHVDFVSVCVSLIRALASAEIVLVARVLGSLKQRLPSSLLAKSSVPVVHHLLRQLQHHLTLLFQYGHDVHLRRLALHLPPLRESLSARSTRHDAARHASVVVVTPHHTAAATARACWGGTRMCIDSSTARLPANSMKDVII